MIFIWFFKLILFCLKRFVAYLVDFQVLFVLTILFLILLFLIYKEFKRGIIKIGEVHCASELSLFPSFWSFLEVLVPGLDKVSVQPILHRIGRISLN